MNQPGQRVYTSSSMDPSSQRALGIPAGGFTSGPIFVMGPGGRHILMGQMPPGATQAYAIRPSLQLQPQPTMVDIKSEPPPPPPPPPPPVVVPKAPQVELYLCNTSATDQLSEQDSEKEGGKVSLMVLEQSYQELTSRKIKDTLSSFLPDIPGEIDSVEPITETTLRGLIERPPIGGKEFFPLSGQALLGFRLLPGASLPEQLRLDPPSAEPKHTHRKRKHKHRPLDKTNDSSDPLASSHHVRFPTDAYSFIKQEPSSSSLHPHPPSHPHGYPISNMREASVLVQPSQKLLAGGHAYSTGIPGIAGAAQSLVDPTRKRKKEKKKDKDKDKERRKEKKKRRKEKHHAQEPPTIIHSSSSSHPPGPPPLIPTAPFSQHPHSHPPS